MKTVSSSYSSLSIFVLLAVFLAQGGSTEAQIEDIPRDFSQSGATAITHGWFNDAINSVSNAAKVALQDIRKAKEDLKKAINDGSLNKSIQSGFQSVSQALNSTIQNAKQRISSDTTATG